LSVVQSDTITSPDILGRPGTAIVLVPDDCTLAMNVGKPTPTFSDRLALFASLAGALATVVGMTAAILTMIERRRGKRAERATRSRIQIP
jgi:hypothetical protein